MEVSNIASTEPATRWISTFNERLSLTLQCDIEGQLSVVHILPLHAADRVLQMLTDPCPPSFNGRSCELHDRCLHLEHDPHRHQTDLRFAFSFSPRCESTIYDCTISHLIRYPLQYSYHDMRHVSMSCSLLPSDRRRCRVFYRPGLTWTVMVR